LERFWAGTTGKTGQNDNGGAAVAAEEKPQNDPSEREQKTLVGKERGRWRRLGAWVHTYTSTVESVCSAVKQRVPAARP
jgi:hypothetical protein